MSRFILFFLLFSSALQAQEVLKVQHYGVDQGLPQSSVWDIVEDRYGFLWISTADGLCRFDGYSFTTYRSREGDSLSVGGNTTHLMALDKEGDIWMTHDRGFDRYSSARGSFESLYRYTGGTNVYNKTIGEDSHGRMWVWIASEGLLQYDRRTGRLLKKHSFQGKESVRNSGFSRSALIDNNDMIWFSQFDSSLIRFDTRNEKFDIRYFQKRVHALCLVNDSVILVGTDNGILRYNTKANSIQEIPLVDNRTGRMPYTPISILRVNDHEFWAGTQTGIFVYDDANRKILHHYTSCSDGKENFLFAHELYKDRSGNIWIGTNGDGLKKHSPKGQLFQHYKSGGDKGDIVKSIYADGKDRIYAGYYDNGFDIFSKTKGFVKKIRVGQGPPLFPGDYVYAIVGIDDSRLFLSFIGDSIAFGVFDPRRETLLNLTTQVFNATGPMHSYHNSPMAIMTAEHKLMFNYGDALLEATPGKEGFSSIHLVNRFGDDLISCIFEDSDLNLWVGTLNGYYVKRRNQPDWKKGNPELAKRVKTIAEDAEGHIWLGTVNGLYVIDKNGLSLATYHADESLINDFIYGILRDNSGDMWFSHNRGLTRFNHRTKTFHHFSVEDGLQSNEFNTGAYFKSITGELYFGGINGVNSFFPENIYINENLPMVQITRLEVNDKPLEPDTVAWAKKNLILDYQHSTLAFEFAGMEFTEPTKNQYAYRMTGVDKSWIQSGSKRFARYANMPPGDYSFEVKASNNDGVWNNNPAIIRITIIPPFWQTTWFHVLQLMAGAALVGGIAWFVSRQRYLRKLRLLQVTQRIQQDRDRISRELHDNVGSQLSLISSNLDWVSNPVTALSENERSERLEEVNRISKEVIGHLRETIWALKKPEISFADFTDKLKLIAQQQARAFTGITLTFHDGGTGLHILQPEEAIHLLRICQEAIHNSVKHSQPAHLDISWSCGNGKYHICIKDDGIGFEQAELPSGHYGLENMNERADEMNAVLSIISAPGEGTQVIISK